MSVEIKKVYKEHIPAVRFVGKKYTEEDRVDSPVGGYNVYWEEWHKNGWLDILKNLPQIENLEKCPLGLMGIENVNGEHCNFQYWIGMMLPENSIVPDGFSYLDLPESDVMICWVYGSDESGEIYDVHDLCMEKMFGKDDGWWNNIRNDFLGKDRDFCLWFERYSDARMKKDEKGNVILDYGMYVKG